MEYMYAAMLLHKAGKDITEESLTQVLKAAGVNADSVRVKALVASIAEVDIEEATKNVPSLVAAPSAAPSAPTEAKPEEKKEKEEDKKEKEEAALEGLGALFG